MIDDDRKWVLQAAWSYNHMEECSYPDSMYDYTIKCLQKLQALYPNEWEQSTIYPEVFNENDDWHYTSHHFPNDPTIQKWYDEQQQRINEGRMNAN